jgi:hypothetical protein
LLHRSAERFFPEPEDRALAEVSDFQGVGGKYGLTQEHLEVQGYANNTAPGPPEKTPR